MSDAPRRRIEQFPATVTRVIRETADTVTLELDAPAAPPYVAGQFLTINPHQFGALSPFARYLEAAKGKKEHVRAYSLCSAPGEPLAFTVKEEPYDPPRTPFPPLLSPLLVHGVGVGLSMEVTGFTGAFVLPPDAESRADTVVHVVAGSGAVPCFSILKHELRHGRMKHVFIDSNRTHADIIFREPLVELMRAYPERLKVVHLLTREPEAHKHGPHHRHARLTPELLRELVPEPARTESFVCGPGITMHERRAAHAKGEKPAPRFLESAVAMLQELGVPKKQVHHESYG